MRHAQLTFFCELEADALQALLSDAAVIDDLVALDAAVSLGILDLSPERADVVRRLNEAGVPVTAWQLLPEEQGYWFNLDNASQAAARYADFRTWTAEHGLWWAGVGLDIEPDIREVQQLLADRWRLVPALLRRVLDSERLRRAQAAWRSRVLGTFLLWTGIDSPGTCAWPGTGATTSTSSAWKGACARVSWRG